MPPEESKPVDPATTAEAIQEAAAEAAAAGGESSGSESEAEQEQGHAGAGAGDAEAAKQKKKKKSSKKKKLKELVKGKEKETKEPQLSEAQVQQLLDMNPALKGELAKTTGGEGGAKPTAQQLQEMLKRMSVSELLTGMAPGGKNKGDMGSHQFWKTQPVLTFDELGKGEAIQEGPIKQIDPDKVDAEPAPMYPGFEWVTMDLTDEAELEEVWELLNNHYVEDDEAMFRFSYSKSFLDWALKAPGWRKDWHVGVRASQSRKLVAFISGIPVALRVRDRVLKCSEVNFLCVHKKLRNKRLAPVLIKEITRRCYRVGTFQAIYTGGVFLPTPVATCRYYHRSLDWEKLYEVGFSPLPPGSTKARQISKYKLPAKPATPGLRPMTLADVDAVLDLLGRYLARVELAQVFSREEVAHWLVHSASAAPERVVWSYVVEDATTPGRITDFFSFYNLQSTVIGNRKHPYVKAAYLFYYATEAAFQPEREVLKKRLNALVNDALVLAKSEHFDVFNALSLQDNPLFLEQQKFGPGDGQLHYYLYNYKARPIAGGLDEANRASERHMGGVGVVML